MGSSGESLQNVCLHYTGVNRWRSVGGIGCDDIRKKIINKCDLASKDLLLEEIKGKTSLVMEVFATGFDGWETKWKSYL